MDRYAERRGSISSSSLPYASRIPRCGLNLPVDDVRGSLDLLRTPTVLEPEGAAESSNSITYSSESIYLQCYEATGSQFDDASKATTTGAAGRGKTVRGTGTTSGGGFMYYRPTRGSMISVDKLLQRNEASHTGFEIKHDDLYRNLSVDDEGDDGDGGDDDDGKASIALSMRVANTDDEISSLGSVDSRDGQSTCFSVDEHPGVSGGGGGSGSVGCYIQKAERIAGRSEGSRDTAPREDEDARAVLREVAKDIQTNIHGRTTDGSSYPEDTNGDTSFQTSPVPHQQPHEQRQEQDSSFQTSPVLHQTPCEQLTVGSLSKDENFPRKRASDRVTENDAEGDKVPSGVAYVGMPNSKPSQSEKKVEQFPTKPTIESLKTSKLEKVNELYTDRDHESESEQNNCLWVGFKLLTWLFLILSITALLFASKLAVCISSQFIIVPVNMNLTALTRNNHVSNSRSSTCSPLVVPKAAPTRGNISSLDNSQVAHLWGLVLSDRRAVYLDTTMLLLVFAAMVTPSVIGLLAGVYDMIRWRAVRRAKLGCRAFLLTMAFSFVECLGVSTFMFEVLPNVGSHWTLIVPTLMMALPSASHLLHHLRCCSTRKKILCWTGLIGCNVTAVVLLYVELLLFSTDNSSNLHLLWSLPVAVGLTSAAWIQRALQWQVEGTYNQTGVDAVAGSQSPEQLLEAKAASLRAKHKLLSSLFKLMCYPLAVFVVVVVCQGYGTWLRLIEQGTGATQRALHHPLLPYVVAGTAGSLLCPPAVWVLFTAAVEVQLVGKDGRRPWPVSGSLLVLLLTHGLALSGAVTGLPCLVMKAAACCPPPSPLAVAMVATSGTLMLLGSLPVIFKVMIANHALHMSIDRVFTLSVVNSVLPDIWVWLNITPSSLNQRAKVADFRALRQRSKIYICTTMYREDEQEMLELLKSIKRINDTRSLSTPRYEAHVFVDGALPSTPDGRTRFNAFSLQLATLVEKTFETHVDQFAHKATPYGIQWQVNLCSKLCSMPMLFFIHLKDNAKVKKKKRWSQIMYMAWAIDHDGEVPVEDRYVLITDGDTRFYEKGVAALLDALLLSPEAAAVVGRVRPVITSSPLVWYQAFEYAASFWIYKASNDQLGTDLCCSGCFTMYRGAMLKGVIKDYAADAKNARDFLMIDMGEDLWLSTLLIQSGYKLKYCSVADVYTQAPCRLEEYYKQRRRWYLSSLAYFFFFISEFRRFKYGNRHVTLAFLLYQGCLLCFPLISTSTLGMVLAIAQAYAFMIPILWSSLLVLVIFGLQHLFCLFARSSVQVKASALLSILPSVSTVGIVVVVVQNVCLDYINAFSPNNGTTLANDRIAMTTLPVPAPTMLLTLLAAVILFTGLLHPKEFYYIFYVIFYIIGSPVGYIFLRPYMLCNVTDQSWGTREMNISDKESQHASLFEKLKSCLRACACCCQKEKVRETHPFHSRSGISLVPDVIAATTVLSDSELDSGSTSQIFNSDQLSSVPTSVSMLDFTVSDQSNSVVTSIPGSKKDYLIDEMANMELTEEVKNRILTLRDELEVRNVVYTGATSQEDRFWEQLIELKLSNAETAVQKYTQEQVKSDLRRFQRRMLIVYFALNAVWLVLILLFWHYFGDSLRMNSWGRYFNIVMIIGIPYLVFNIIQFVALFFHRMGIWFYLLAETKVNIGNFIKCGYPIDSVEEKADVLTKLGSDEKREIECEKGAGIVPKSTLISKSAVSTPGTDAVAPAFSKFQDSRWLLGNTDDSGTLTREVAARGMMLSASEESLTRPRQQKEDQEEAKPDQAVPVATTATRSRTVPVQQGSPQPRGSSTAAVTARRSLLSATTPPSAKRYRVGTPDSRLSSLVAPVSRCSSRAASSTLDVKAPPQLYFTELARRQAALSRSRPAAPT